MRRKPIPTSEQTQRAWATIFRSLRRCEQDVVLAEMKNEGHPLANVMHYSLIAGIDIAGEQQRENEENLNS